MSNESSEEQRQKSCPSTDGMLELDSLNLDGAITAAQDVSSQNNHLSSPNLADSNHHDINDTDSSSDDDDDDNEGISASYHPSSMPSSLHHTNQSTTYFLGQTFNTTQLNQIQMNTYTKSLYWLTYRNDLVVPLRPYSATNAQSLVGNLTHGGGLSGVTGEGGMKTDAGWGCMLRSAQMMLAECVKRHYNTLEVKNKNKKKRVRNNEQSCSSTVTRRNQRNGSSSSSSSIEHHKLNWKQLDDPYEVERIANWFADFPNHADYDALLTVGEEEEDLVNGCNVKEEEEMKNTKQRIVKSAEQRLDQDDDIGKGGLAYHWYSLHQMVAAGLGLGILPGEWYGPTTACHVLRELNEIHVDRRMRLLARQRKKNRKNLYDEDETNNNDDDDVKCDVFRVHVATEGCVYLDTIAKLMNQSGGGCNDTSTSTNDKIDEDHPLSLPTDNDDQIIDDPLRLPTQDQNAPIHSNKSLENMDNTTWDTSLLLLLPLRLGIQSISTSNYGSTLARLISFPQSVGMLGGTPRHALWFYGADAVDPPPPLSDDIKDGSDKKNSSSEAGGWYGLDPHTVQLAPRGTRVLVEDNGNDETNNDSVTDTTTPRYQWQVQLTDTYLRSLHISSTTSHHNHDKSIPLSNLDPSCALGFYIHDHTDFVHFQGLLNKLSTDHCKPNKLPEIITILEKTPNYKVDVSSAMHDMIGGKGKERTMDGVSMVDDIDEFSMQSEEGNDEDDNDDDDFVLI